MLSVSFKGRAEKLALPEGAESTDVVFDLVREVYSLEDQNLKLLVKGKQIAAGVSISSTPLADGAKVMVMATGKRDVDILQSQRSDPTVRGFDAEDRAAKQHALQQNTEELSVWATPQDSQYRFCRFEACTWQSFGTRPSSSTPHGFEARQLLLKLAQDPAIVHIMRERRWTVGLLAEQDPIDDRLQEKMEGGGKRLLGYNTNMGAEIHVRLRTEDLKGFMPYTALVDTLLHELCHNEVGPHNDHFWHLFCSLKVDYLGHLTRLSSQGALFGGRSPLQLASAQDEARDVRTAVLAALERDSQQPAGPLHTRLLDDYLAASAAMRGDAGRILGAPPSAAAASSGEGDASSRRGMRELLAAKANERLGLASSSGALEPSSSTPGRAGASRGIANAVPMDATPPDGKQQLQEAAEEQRTEQQQQHD